LRDKMVFTKSLSNGQLIDSADINTLVGDISGTWAVNSNDRFCISGETYSVTGGVFPLTQHYYYLNPGADVYVQLKRLKLSYACVASLNEGYGPSNRIGIQVYYNIGGGEVKIYEHFEVFNHWGGASGNVDEDLESIPASTSSKSTDPYIKIILYACTYNMEDSGSVYTTTSTYNNFRLSYTVSDSI